MLAPPTARHGTHPLARLAAVRHRAALLALAELALRAAVAAEVEREAALALGLAVLGLAVLGLRLALAAIRLARLAIAAAAAVVGMGPLEDGGIVCGGGGGGERAVRLGPGLLGRTLAHGLVLAATPRARRAIAAAAAAIVGSERLQDC